MSAAAGFNPVPMSDVEGCVRNCADVFSQLSALLATIRDKAAEDGADAAKLAALGYAAAFDMENFAGHTLEQMQKGGVTV